MPALLQFGAPLLLVDLDKVIGIAFVIFWIVAWVLKLISSQAQKGPPIAPKPRPTVRPGDDRLQEEIDIFIKEVGPKKTARRPVSAPPVPTEKAARARKPPLKQSVATPGAGRSESPRRKVGEGISSRHIPGGEATRGRVQQHLRDHMQERVAKEAAAHLNQAVDEQQSRQLVETSRPIFAQGDPAPAETAAKALRVAELLRNPANLKQSIAVSLILSPPLARQSRTGRA